MSRPLLKYKIQRNGSSVKMYEEGQYVGSMPLKRLSYYIKLGQKKNASFPKEPNSSSDPAHSYKEMGELPPL